jgi:hypothetical protein
MVGTDRRTVRPFGAASVRSIPQLLVVADSGSGVSGLGQIIQRLEEFLALTHEKTRVGQGGSRRHRARILHQGRPDYRTGWQARIEELTGLRHDQALLAQLIPIEFLPDIGEN